MATILLAWELGGGLGHLLPLRVLGQCLVQRGHRVIAAVRDLHRVGGLFAGTGIAYLPAPVHVQPRTLQKIEGFAHILATVGYADPSILSTLFSAWNTLFACVQPDLVVADYAPTVHLALHGLAVPRVTVCPAFCCPPDTFPLPYWWTGTHARPHAQMVQDEEKLTQIVNGVLAKHKRPPLQRLGPLFHEADEVILSTYRELDPFDLRPPTRYWGHWHADGGTDPLWPTGIGPKIYVYLKRSPLIGEVLGALQRLGIPSLIFAGEIDPRLPQQFASATMRFETRPLKMQMVAAHCDLAILNGGHGTTASMLLAGKPCLLFPSHTEQLLTAQAVAKIGAGRWVSPNAAGQIEGILREIIVTPPYKTAAQAFAGRYAGFEPGQQVAEIVDHIESWIGTKHTVGLAAPQRDAVRGGAA